MRRDAHLSPADDVLVTESLKGLGLMRMRVEAKGACLFQSLSLSVFGSDKHHLVEIRKRVVTLIEMKYDSKILDEEVILAELQFVLSGTSTKITNLKLSGDRLINAYTKEMEKPLCFGGDIERITAMELFGRRVC